MQATLILPSGRTAEIQANKPFTLEEMQTLVLGDIEIVDAKDGRYLIVNEEGKNNELPVNEEATKLLSNRFPDVLVGPVILCTQDMVE